MYVRVLTSEHAPEVGARCRQYDPVGAKLSSPNVNYHVAQLLLSTKLFEHTESCSLDELGRIHEGLLIRSESWHFCDIPVRLGTAFCAVHPAR